MIDRDNIAAASRIANLPAAGHRVLWLAQKHDGIMVSPGNRVDLVINSPTGVGKVGKTGIIYLFFVFVLSIKVEDIPTIPTIPTGISSGRHYFAS